MVDGHEQIKRRLDAGERSGRQRQRARAQLAVVQNLELQALAARTRGSEASREANVGVLALADEDATGLELRSERKWGAQPCADRIGVETVILDRQGIRLRDRAG